MLLSMLFPPCPLISETVAIPRLETYSTDPHNAPFVAGYALSLCIVFPKNSAGWRPVVCSTPCVFTPHPGERATVTHWI
jgi:hypothetical protein